ncbi:major facilitator superfamily domain-containing protein 6-A isoform X3 [Belonocnema kinseyi]|nr:major facilitator superfamily domain-containing protein 6-A isoform X3 [Belonocnema kinseyi]
MLLASLSCWIIFTLPLGFIQPPVTTCMIEKNYSYYLSAPENLKGPRIVKRSINNDELSSATEDTDYLEVAANVVFERVRRNVDDHLLVHHSLPLGGTSYHLSKLPTLSELVAEASNYKQGLQDRRTRQVRSPIPDNDSTNLRYEHFIVDDAADNTDHGIDIDTIVRKNRPADVLEYKHFLKNEPLNDRRSPKKAHSRPAKTRSKPTPQKVMVKRETDHSTQKEDLKTDLKEIESSKIYAKSIMYSRVKEEEEEEEFIEKMEKMKREEEEENFVDIDEMGALGEDSGENDEDLTEEEDEESSQQFVRHRRSVNKYPRASAGQSPLSVDYATNYNGDKDRSLVKPLFSSIVYSLPDIQKTFFLLLLLVVVGEFFAAPAITLADSAVITLLGEDADRYGHQRMFGSLGWGLAMFFVGIALDHSTSFPDHPCGPDAREKNYTICFAIFSVLMGGALITATQITFKYDFVASEPEISKKPAEITREEQLQNQLSQQLNLPGLLDSSTSAPTQQPATMESKSKIFAQTTREIPEWVTVIRQFKDLKCASFLFVAWFMGFGIGLIFTFLFWHLQDYGGSSTLFGVASVINHISEIFAYFFSFRLIRQMGHVKVLCLGLGGNVLRFLYISWLKNPWWVLPFEFIQGITHAAVWAACCSYIAHNTPPQLRSSAQGVLQGLHHGLGRGCGAIIGGMLVASYGTTIVFRTYGFVCLLVLGGFIFINFYRVDTGFVSDLPPTEDPHQVAEATHLAPHGVPSNAIPRALSSSRLHELANQDSGYGATYSTSGGNLGVPGSNGGNANPNNPFLNGGGGGGGGGGGDEGYNYSITGKGEDEFIRRSFQIYSEVVGTELKIVKPPPVVTHLHAQQPCTNPFHQHEYDW